DLGHGVDGGRDRGVVGERKRREADHVVVCRRVGGRRGAAGQEEGGARGECAEGEGSAESHGTCLSRSGNPLVGTSLMKGGEGDAQFRDWRYENGRLDERKVTGPPVPDHPVSLGRLTSSASHVRSVPSRIGSASIAGSVQIARTSAAGPATIVESKSTSVTTAHSRPSGQMRLGGC